MSETNESSYQLRISNSDRAKVLLGNFNDTQKTDSIKVGLSPERMGKMLNDLDSQLNNAGNNETTRNKVRRNWLEATFAQVEKDNQNVPKSENLEKIDAAARIIEVQNGIAKKQQYVNNLRNEQETIQAGILNLQEQFGIRSNGLIDKGRNLEVDASTAQLNTNDLKNTLNILKAQQINFSENTETENKPEIAEKVLDLLHGLSSDLYMLKSKDSNFISNSQIVENVNRIADGADLSDLRNRRIPSIAEEAKSLINERTKLIIFESENNEISELNQVSNEIEDSLKRIAQETNSEIVLQQTQEILKSFNNFYDKFKTNRAEIKATREHLLQLVQENAERADTEYSRVEGIIGDSSDSNLAEYKIASLNILDNVQNELTSVNSSEEVFLNTLEETKRVIEELVGALSK